MLDDDVSDSATKETVEYEMGYADDNCVASRLSELAYMEKVDADCLQKAEQNPRDYRSLALVGHRSEHDEKEEID